MYYVRVNGCRITYAENVENVVSADVALYNSHAFELTAVPALEKYKTFCEAKSNIEHSRYSTNQNKPKTKRKD